MIENWFKMENFLILLLICLTAAAQAESEDNVCHSTELETKQINTTYLQAVQIKTFEFCLTPPLFRCAKYENNMETRWKTQNITRTVPKAECCPGYKNVSRSCVPHCSHHCINGNCTQPETCSCNSGFSGDRCEVAGCPGGRWGPDCSRDCSCEHGGFCAAVSGACTCTPGYHGIRCQAQCPTGKYGAGCGAECECSPGFQCQHVTGDCSPCPPGTFGESCAGKCDCVEEGTELCSHQDGKCYCKPNRFGKDCSLNCPFGYINGTCHSTPLVLNGTITTCECSNYLYTCDPVLGCLCPEGVDCGVQQNIEVLSVAPLSSGGEGLSPGVVAVVALLILGLAAVILVIIYYRKRLTVMKKDLMNRRVIYMENNYNYNSSGETSTDIVIQDTPPLGVEVEHQRLRGESANLTARIEPRNGRLSPLLLTNNKLTLDSQIFVRNPTDEMLRKEKNVNCNNFTTAASGAAADPVGHKELNINMYQGEYKKTDDKKNIDAMIKNNLTVDLTGATDGASSCRQQNDNKLYDELDNLKADCSK